MRRLNEKYFNCITCAKFALIQTRQDYNMMTNPFFDNLVGIIYQVC